MPAMKDGRWLNVAAVGTWIVCGVYPMSAMTAPFTWWPDGTAIAVYLIYGAALAVILTLPRLVHGFCGPYLPHALAATQSVTALLFNYISGVHLGGTGVGIGLLVIVAAEVPFFLAPGAVWAWIGVQTLASTLMFFPTQSSDWLSLLSFGIAAGGFQMFAAASSMLLRNEQASREQLSLANAELLETRALLAENSRTAERLRISRDLHDTLGHHLTALSLRLDVASRLAEGRAADHVRQAHAIARLLLADVRDVVGSLREPTAVDVAQAVRSLTVQQTGIAVHLDLPPALSIGDHARADTLIRCVQEILTNAARHSGARNLWIRMDVRPDGVTLEAHDDGRGAASIDYGHGLTGMRERFEQNAGHVEFQWGPGTGFRVRGFLPLPALA